MAEVERIDKYTVDVEGVQVRANEDQEARIKALTEEQRARFVKIMGGNHG